MFVFCKGHTRPRFIINIISVVMSLFQKDPLTTSVCFKCFLVAVKDLPFFIVKIIYFCTFGINVLILGSLFVLWFNVPDNNYGQLT